MANKKLSKKVHALASKMYKVQRSLTYIYSNLLDIEEQIASAKKRPKKIRNRTGYHGPLR